MDVAVFQQWKHWHKQSIDDMVRHGIGDFNRQTFFSVLEDIRSKTLKEGTIKSAFRKCGIVPFRPAVILNMIPFEELRRRTQNTLQRQITPDLEQSPSLPSVWGTPKDFKSVQKQASAIQDILRSSASPPDTPTRQQYRSNTKRFMQGITASNIVYSQLLTYHFDSHLAQLHQKSRNSRSYPEGRNCLH